MKKLGSNINSSEKLTSISTGTFDNIIGRNQNIIVQRFNKWSTINIQTITAPFEKYEYTGREGLVMKEKIPTEFLIKSFIFFKQVHDKYKTEAFSLIVRNKKNNSMELYIPTQVVSGALVNYTLPEKFNEQYEILVNLHSHHTMKISFSSTDDKDDKGQTTISGVIKDIYDNPEIDLRIWSINKFIDLDVRDVFDLEDKKLNITLDEYLKYPHLLDLLENKWNLKMDDGWIKKIIKSKPIINNKKYMNNKNKNVPVYHKDPLDEYYDDEWDSIMDKDIPKGRWYK
jgi:PRTRC genetic system protein A